MINTTHGMLDDATLARTVGFEDRPVEFVVWVEWRLAAHDGVDCAVCQNPDMPTPDASGLVVVRRDAHVILKQASVVAEAIAGGL